jgi:hypothetical protein
MIEEETAARALRALREMWTVVDPYQNDEAVIEIAAAHLEAYWVALVTSAVREEDRAAERYRAWTHLQDGIDTVLHGLDRAARGTEH